MRVHGEAKIIMRRRRRLGRSSSPFFSSVPNSLASIVGDAVLAEILSGARTRTLRRHELLVLQGDPSTYVYVVEQGGLLLYRANEEIGRAHV